MAAAIRAGLRAFDAFALIDTLVAVPLEAAGDDLVDRWAHERRLLAPDHRRPHAVP